MKHEPIRPAHSEPPPRIKLAKAAARKPYQFRFSDDEMELLDLKAKEAGIDRTKFLRKVIAQSIVINSAAARGESRLLSNLANNMNQIAHVANAYKEDADALAIVHQLRRIDMALRQAFHLSDVPLLKPTEVRRPEPAGRERAS